jgi:hypothetical protein
MVELHNKISRLNNWGKTQNGPVQEYKVKYVTELALGCS